MYNDELYHHGVKGQRWGLRRYQNPDGTRTEAGKKRAQKARSSKTKGFGAKIKSVLANRKKKKLLKKAKQAQAARELQAKLAERRKKKIASSPSLIRKHADEFTVEELQTIKKRLELDRDFAKLTQDKFNRGKDYVNSISSVLENSIKIYNGVSAVVNAYNEQSGTGAKARVLINTNPSNQKKDNS